MIEVELHPERQLLEQWRAACELTRKPDRGLDFWVWAKFWPLALKHSHGTMDMPAHIEVGDGEFRLFDADMKSRGWIGFHCVPRLSADVDVVLTLIDAQSWGDREIKINYGGQHPLPWFALIAPCYAGNGWSLACALLSAFLGGKIHAYDSREENAA